MEIAEAESLGQQRSPWTFCLCLPEHTIWKTARLRPPATLPPQALVGSHWIAQALEMWTHNRSLGVRGHDPVAVEAGDLESNVDETTAYILAANNRQTTLAIHGGSRVVEASTFGSTSPRPGFADKAEK